MSGTSTQPMMSLAGKRVVVIGGSSGIGFAVAAQALGLGAEAVIASSDAGRVQAAAARLPGATGKAVNLRDEAGVAAFFTGLGDFDHLVLTAGDWGTSMFAPARDVDLELMRDGFTVRFWGALAAVKHACRTIAADGSITLTGGVMSQRPAKGMPLATAIGGAIEHLAKGLAIDLAPVRVNAVSPGLVLTEVIRQFMPEERRQGFVAGLPLPRCATPDEAAAAYIYLMLNGYITGQILPVDGGGGLV
ncbi:MAG: SDR family oxidoreductase [Azospirillaceae bacterium]|nr:SDR family oxidoreductase [Azospirillaceae bacterium]